MSSNTNIINPKPCVYNCNTRIYWNISENAYWEVFSKKKHVCPNRSNKITTTNNNTSSNANNRPFYYKNKVRGIRCPKMSNLELELLSDPMDSIQKNMKFQILISLAIINNGRNNKKMILIHAATTAILQCIRILLKMNIGKYTITRNISVNI